jgi:hypothetical protein
MIGVAHIALLLTVLVLQAWIPVTTAEPFEIFGDKVTSKVTVVSGHWVVDVSHTKHPIEYYRVWYVQCYWFCAVGVGCNVKYCCV